MNIKGLPFIFCVVFFSQAALGSDLRKSVQDFKSKEQKHWSGDVRMTESEINMLVKSLLRKTRKHLLKKKVHFRELLPHSLLLASKGSHELNIFSKRMDSEYTTKVQYNLRYLFEHPYAEASFSRREKTIYLPHLAIVDATVKVRSIEHESIHAKVFHNLINKKPMPYYGHFSGKLFRPNDLYLDEMYAYFFDLKAAASELNKYLESPDLAQVDSARLKLIVSEREKDHPPQLPPLTTFETLFDSVVKNIILGRWHTDPAYNALKNLKLSNNVSFVIEDETVAAKVDSSDFTATIFLIDSKSTDFEKNGRILRNYLKAVGDRVKEHKQRWSEAQALYQKVTNSKIEDRLLLLRSLAEKIESFSLKD